MELVLGTSSFFVLGGSESYLLTVAHELQRLGHGVTVYALDLGAAAELARSQGFRVADTSAGLPERCDAALVQDSVVSYQLAERYPAAPQVFVSHTEIHDFMLPPNLPGLVGHVVVPSDRFARRIRAMATDYEVVRLTQPVDAQRFKPLYPIHAVPRRALLLGNYLQGARLQRLVDAFTARGIECKQVGGTSTVSIYPERQIWEADIVVGKGRVALEGMACGRAVYVYDEFGSDGWVTAERYPMMEADNFAGRARGTIADALDLEADLGAYNENMGRINRDLVLQNHGARAHAGELSRLFKGALAPSISPMTPLLELARLVRLQWQTERHVESFERAHGELLARFEHQQERYGELEREHDRVLALTRTRRARVGIELGRIVDRIRGVTGART